MSDKPENGKTTAALVIQIASVLIVIIAGISTPLILMYSKLNMIETQLNERLIEVESQFNSNDELRNVQYANTMRNTSLLWHKVYGEDFPGEVYYPHIAKHGMK